MRQTVNTTSHRLQLILQIARAQWKAEEEKTYLGVIWSIIEPVLNMMVYYVVFSYFLGISTPNFVVFLLVGFVAWNWFAANIINGQRAILNNKGLLRQAPVEKSVFPLAHFVSSLNEFGFSLIVVEGFLLFYGIRPSVHYLALPLVLLVESSLILGIMLPLSAVIPFFPDLGNLVAHLVRLVFYFVGIFYSTDIIDPKYLGYYYFNPMAVVVTTYREILIEHQWPSRPGHLIAITAVASLGGLFGLHLLRRFEGIYVKRVFK